MAVALKIYKRETKDLNVSVRQERGKGPVGRLRREQEMLPGIIYGHGQEPYAFKIPAHDLERAMSGGGTNAMYLLHGEDGPTTRAVVRDVQYHKVRGDIVHIDFLRIDPDEELTTTVPLNTTGNPVGVRVGGGALQHSLTEIEMTAIASEMPSQLEIDISNLEIGDSIHVSDLIEQESRIITDPEVTIVSVLSPRLTIDEELEAAEAAEGEEGEEGEAAEGDTGDEGGAGESDDESDS